MLVLLYVFFELVKMKKFELVYYTGLQSARAGDVVMWLYRLTDSGYYLNSITVCYGITLFVDPQFEVVHQWRTDK